MSPGSDSRQEVSEVQKRIVWARSAGRCAACQKLLTEGSLTRRDMMVGELAHIVGQKNSAGSPRGLSNMTNEERNSADNLILLCAREHRESDRRVVVDLMDVDKLREMKRRHEEWVETVTGLSPEMSTVVVRMIVKDGRVGRPTAMTS